MDPLPPTPPRRNPPAGTSGFAIFETPGGWRTVSLIGLACFGLLYTIHIAKPVLIPIMMAMLFNFIFKPMQRLLVRLGINVYVSATLILLTILGTIFVGAYNLSGPFVSWVDRMPANIRQADEKLDDVTQALRRLGRAAQQVDEITEMKPDGSSPAVEVREKKFIQTVLEVAQQLFVYLMLSLILLWFLLVYGDILLAKLAGAGGTMEIVREIHDYMSRYLFTITVINISLGMCIAAAMFMLGMPNPMLWGAMGTLLNFIPYIGAWVGVGAMAIVSMVTFDNTVQIFLTPFIYMMLTSTEGNFITPIILGQRFTLNPIVIFVWLIFWGWIWGVAGAFIAVPLLVAFKILCDHTESLRWISELITITKEDEAKAADRQGRGGRTG